MPYGLDKPGHAYGRLGVFKTLADVPPAERLGFYDGVFTDRDVLAEWDAATGGFTSTAERQQRELSNVRESWTAFMADPGPDGGAGRDPALADPEHVDRWLQAVMDGEDASAYAGRTRSAKRAMNPYYITLLAFYEWLAGHADYPHRYNPVLMAAVEFHDGATGEVWRARYGCEPLPDRLDPARLGDPSERRDHGGRLQPDGGVLLTDGGVVLTDGGAEQSSAGSQAEPDDGEDVDEGTGSAALTPDEIEAKAAEMNGVPNPSDPLAGADGRMRQLAGIGADPYQQFRGQVLRDRRPQTRRGWDATWRKWTAFMAHPDGGDGRHPTCPSKTHARAFVDHLVASDGESEIFPELHQKSTVRGYLSLLGGFFDWMNGNAAWSTHDTGFNPFKDLKKRGAYPWPAEAAKEKEFRVPTEAEMREAVRRVPHVRDRAVVVLQAKLGLRTGEVRNLRLKDLQLHDDLLQSHYPSLGENHLLRDGTGGPKYDEQCVVIMPRKTDDWPNGYDGNKSVVPRVLLLDADARRALVDWLLIRPDDGEEHVFLSRTTHKKIRDKSAFDPAWQQALPESEGWGETAEYRSVSSHIGRHYFTTHYEVRTPVGQHVVDYLRGDARGSGEHATAKQNYIHVTAADGFEAMRQHAPRFNLT